MPSQVARLSQGRKRLEHEAVPVAEIVIVGVEVVLVAPGRNILPAHAIDLGRGVLVNPVGPAADTSALAAFQVLEVALKPRGSQRLISFLLDA